MRSLRSSLRYQKHLTGLFLRCFDHRYLSNVERRSSTNNPTLQSRSGRDSGMTTEMQHAQAYVSIDCSPSLCEDTTPQSPNKRNRSGHGFKGMESRSESLAPLWLWRRLPADDISANTHLTSQNVTDGETSYVVARVLSPEGQLLAKWTMW